MEEEEGERDPGAGGGRRRAGGRAEGGRAGGRGRRLRLLRLLPLLVWEGDGAERAAFNPAHPSTPEALTAPGAGESTASSTLSPRNADDLRGA